MLVHRGETVLPRGDDTDFRGVRDCRGGEFVGDSVLPESLTVLTGSFRGIMRCEPWFGDLCPSLLEGESGAASARAGNAWQ